MPSQQKKYLRQQAIARADKIREEQARQLADKVKSEPAPIIAPLRGLYEPCTITKSTRKPPQSKSPIKKTPLQEPKPDIRKTFGVKIDNGVITESHNGKKALASRKRAHHKPLITTSLRAGQSHTATNDTFKDPAPGVGSNGDSDDSAHSTAYRVVDAFPSEYVDLPKPTTPRSPTRSESSSIQSVDGFTANFLFEAPKVVPSLMIRLQPPGLFKMPPALANTTKTSFALTPGYDPAFTFQPPQPPLGRVLEAEEPSDHNSQVAATHGALREPDADGAIKDVEQDVPYYPSVSEIAHDVPEFPASMYPLISFAVFGQSTDIVTPKLVALGIVTTSAPYSADLQRNGIADMAVSHTSTENFGSEYESSDEDREYWYPSDLDILSMPNDKDDSSLLAGSTGYADASRSEDTESSDHTSCRFDDCLRYAASCNEDEAQTPSNSTVTPNESITQPKWLSLTSSPVMPSRRKDEDQALVASMESSVESSDQRKWLRLTSSPSADPSASSHQPATAVVCQDDPALSAFVFLRSEMTNITSSQIEESPCPIQEIPSFWPGAQSSLTDPVVPSSSESVAFDNEVSEQSISAASELDESIVSPDWTAELVHTMLGTESLFAFLSTLDTDNDGITSKAALVDTFLTLVTAEREKLGLPSLPVACSPSTILASKILPHTTVLGTTSLSTFLAQFDFASDDTVDAGDIYHVFKDLCKEETRKKLQTTTGIMGKLGVRLGKLVTT